VTNWTGTVAMIDTVTDDGQEIWRPPTGGFEAQEYPVPLYGRSPRGGRLKVGEVTGVAVGSFSKLIASGTIDLDEFGQINAAAVETLNNGGEVSPCGIAILGGEFSQVTVDGPDGPIEVWETGGDWTLMQVEIAVRNPRFAATTVTLS
jgi:hypothetical protein